MSNPQLDGKELYLRAAAGLGLYSNLTPAPTDVPLPSFLGRHLTVFQVPSATTPNYFHYVIGSKKDGWRCTCVGYQAHGRCYHSDAVALLIDTLTTEQHQRQRQLRRSRADLSRGAKRHEEDRVGGPHKGKKR